MSKITIKKECTICKFFKNTEVVFDGYIDHRTESGAIWMREPKHKTVPRHCPLHKKTFDDWWNIVKDRKSSEDKIEVDCDDFEPSDGFKEFNLPLLEMIELTKQIINK